MKQTILTIASILLCFQLSFAQKEIDVNYNDGGSDADTTKVTNNGGSELCTFEFGNADISTAKYICSKSAFSEPHLGKGGLGENEITVEGSRLQETHAAWYRFDILKPGLIELSLIPLNPNDDLDFVLYQWNKKANQWEIVRAATSGPAVGGEEAIFCNGNMTGLQKDDPDTIEKDGCISSLEVESDTDGFVASLDVKEGEQYLLCVNNFLSCEGFSGVWGGTFEFQECPIKNKISSNANPYNNTYVSEPYPNPSNESIKIDIYYPNQHNNKTTNTEIKVLDISGKQLLKKTTELQRGNQSIGFDVSDLAQGMYQIIFTLDGAPYTRKFIKQ